MSDKHDISSDRTVPASEKELATAIEDATLSSPGSVSSHDTALWSPNSEIISLKDDGKAGDCDPDFVGTREEQDVFLGMPQAPSPTEALTTPLIEEESQKPPPKRQAASWSELPRKGQVALLIISRLSEPITQTSLQSYMFYQLKSFDASQPESVISAQAGWMTAGFTAAQFCTAFAWGRAADSEIFGRKKVLLLGLLGTMVSAVGFGFSSNFASALFFRCVGGALNGNVGVMRVMISEIIKEKRFQSRAFVMIPMTFNIGVIIGPIFGGLLSNPVDQYPGVFGPGSLIGGKDGVWWMRRWPYAFPNLVNAISLLCSALALFLGLEETHEVLRQRPDLGRHISSWLARNILRRKSSHSYSAIPADDHPDTPLEDIALGSKPVPEQPRHRRKLPFQRIFTRNVIITLISHGLLASHAGTFNQLWFTLLSTARFDPKSPDPPSHETQRFPFHFTGGLFMPPAKIGLALSIVGFIGITLQLLLYPRLSAHLGTALSYRIFLFLFPVAYTLAPYLVLLPSSAPPPKAADGPLIWMGITVVLALYVCARTFALPGATILVNNSCPHPSVLGQIHGIAQSVNSGVRTLIPAVAGWLYGRGLEWGVVGTAWWGLAAMACAGCAAGFFVREGTGHEIFLEGEEEEMRQAEIQRPRGRGGREP